MISSPSIFTAATLPAWMVCKKVLYGTSVNIPGGEKAGGGSCRAIPSSKSSIMHSKRYRCHSPEWISLHLYRSAWSGPLLLFRTGARSFKCISDPSLPHLPRTEHRLNPRRKRIRGQKKTPDCAPRRHQEPLALPSMRFAKAMP